MKLRSLAYRTDLFFPAFDGQILDRGDYLVVRTPSNPTFYWGNFLLFSHPPGAGDDLRWRELFAHEIGVLPIVQHQVFGWDSPEGETGLIEPFLRLGFEANLDLVLTSTGLHPPPRPAASVTIRPLASDADWQAAIELQVTCREPGHDEAGHRLFRIRSMDRYRRMSAAGRGDWYGAFFEGQLVADLGLFHQDGIARYQSVSTHPDFRRRGIASMLVYEAGRQAIARYSVHTLVIVAEPDSSASRLYGSVGFAPAERSVGLTWWQHEDASAPGD